MTTSPLHQNLLMNSADSMQQLPTQPKSNFCGRHVTHIKNGIQLGGSLCLAGLTAYLVATHSSIFAVVGTGVSSAILFTSYCLDRKNNQQRIPEEVLLISEPSLMHQSLTHQISSPAPGTKRSEANIEEGIESPKTLEMQKEIAQLKLQNEVAKAVVVTYAQTIAAKEARISSLAATNGQLEIRIEAENAKHEQTVTLMKSQVAELQSDLDEQKGYVETLIAFNEKKYSYSSINTPQNQSKVNTPEHRRLLSVFAGNMELPSPIHQASNMQGAAAGSGAGSFIIPPPNFQ